MIAGNKPNWAREIDTDNFQDMFGLSAAAAKKLQIVSGKSTKDLDGNNRNIVNAVSFETTRVTLTDYATFPIGSTILQPNISTGPLLFVKVASSTTPVIGDWYEVAMTQVI